MKTLIAAPLLLIGAAANAVPVVGSSGGSFSNLSSCDTSYTSIDDCRIVSTSNGTNTQVQWGSQSRYSSFVNPSTLTSVDLNINTNTDGGGLGIAIARLDWYNSATLYLNDSLDQFFVNWGLSLSFSSPNGPDPYGFEQFNLQILNPINPAGDMTFGLGLADLSNLRGSFNLAGVTVSNLRYSVVDGAGTGGSWFNDNLWYNSENNWSSLYILADFRSNTASVPEPATLGLFGLGLMGVAFASRKRKGRKSST